MPSLNTDNENPVSPITLSRHHLANIQPSLQRKIYRDTDPDGSAVRYIDCSQYAGSLVNVHATGVLRWVWVEDNTVTPTTTATAVDSTELDSDGDEVMNHRAANSLITEPVHPKRSTLAYLVVDGGDIYVQVA